ncbi:sensor histidine kinase [Adlercreutzia caecimuris]|uniref:sensor histidine kinase n=2 Tax=Adlercreutzia caecimuris TaxID=671266 RepID=UPI00272A5E70|nr:HAMP domain-containing sensor histidine kinase [Adlercreutzia caecimuris]
MGGLGVLCGFLIIVLMVLAAAVLAYERQMRGLSQAMAVRGRELRRLRLSFPTPAARQLAQAANCLVDEADDARRQAAEERRALQANLASFSHDVRTPLAGAQGFLQLYAVADDDAERDECVTAAVERLSAMRILVDSLFEYAKADDGSRELAREPVDVAAVASDVLATLYPAFAERGWRPEVSLAEDAVIEADGEAVRRIVENLLANCLRHGSAAPTVELRATGSEATGFALVISNAAAGLGTLDEGRLGERFYRGDASRRAGGSGLGLATACSLADAMGLRLLLSIESGHFTVTLSS